MKTALKIGMATLAVAFLAETASADYRPKDVYLDEAQPRRSAKKAPYRRNDGYRFVLVESHYGSRSVVAPVRLARLGTQVKLPGGAWVYCEITCEYTVRRMSLDFWEGQGQNFTSPGYLRRNFYLD